jgi:hypothetical protein
MKQNITKLNKVKIQAKVNLDGLKLLPQGKGVKSMDKNCSKNLPFMKEFYRISKERLKAYLDKLNEINDVLQEVKPSVDTNSIDIRKIEDVQGKVIDVYSSLLGFRYYEDAEVGGEVVDDAYLFNQYFNKTELNNLKFYEIEFGKTKKGR